MVVDLFSKALETPKTLPQPLVKANKLFVENMEKLLVLQMNSLKSYLDIGLNQMRAAAEITDLQSISVTGKSPSLYLGSRYAFCM